MTLYIFRHGETYFSKNKVPYGTKVESADILPEGIIQAEKIASRLKVGGVKIIYSSPIKRCVQTVQAIKKNYPEVNIVFDNRLEEEKVTRGLENLSDLEKRLKDFVSFVKSKNYKEVGICTHGWPIAALIAILKNGTVKQEDLLSYPRCGELVKITS